MKPTNNLVNPMLTDFYQITMAYAYWKAGVHEEAVFDLFFARPLFAGSSPSTLAWRRSSGFSRIFISAMIISLISRNRCRSARKGFSTG